MQSTVLSTMVRLAAAAALCTVALGAGGPAAAKPPPAIPDSSTVTTAPGTDAVRGTIQAAGPLKTITTGPGLHCDVNLLGDTSGAWYGETACGTFLASGDRLYGPYVPAGTTTTEFGPLSQSETTGSGTAADPYRMTTTAEVAGLGLVLAQTDTYVEGDHDYQTDVVVTNTSTSIRSAVLYRAGDCYFSDSDSGFGRVDDGAPACVAGDAETGEPSIRVERLIPVTPGSHYQIGHYSEVWNTLSELTPLPDTCDCDPVDGSYDNGVGLSWDVALEPGASATYSMRTYFSPPPLDIEVTVDDDAVVPGGSDGYTIEVVNDTFTTVTLDSVTDQLAPRFAYVPGSTSGATTAEPTIIGSNLTWAGPFVVPGGESVSLHFEVLVSDQVGTYVTTVRAVVGGSQTDQTVRPSVDVAPIKVAPVKITKIRPSGAVLGAVGWVLTLTGTTFDEGGAVSVSGDGVTVTRLQVPRSTTAKATISVAPDATIGARDVMFTDAAGNSGTCNGCLTISAAPTITSVDPAALGRGALAAPVVVTGTGFVRAATVTISGVQIASKRWIDSTRIELVVNVPAGAALGPHEVKVDNKNGGVATATITVNSRPTISSASPSVPAGTTLDVTVTGSSFVEGLTVAINGGVVAGAVTAVTPTSFVVQVTVPAGTPPGSYIVTVTNPDRGTGSRRVLTVT